MKKQEQLGITNPLNQLILYGYTAYFDLFNKLFKGKNIPSIILLNGPKGIGKATFVYHFIKCRLY